MNQLKIEVVQKLNAIVELVRHCATKVVSTQDQTLMQEVTLAAITHEGLIKLFEQNGPTQNVITLVNDFGRAVSDLYHNISTFKPTPILPKITQFTTKRPDKNLLN
jgi:hypothetical protein